jgi:hypothetical protein
MVINDNMHLHSSFLKNKIKFIKYKQFIIQEKIINKKWAYGKVDEEFYIRNGIQRTIV